ncbi:MAG TPA: ABC transporter permease [Azospirillaceae bacterium]|nr:ABC transporter permease [Azospirillaceae bacterium]
MLAHYLTVGWRSLARHRLHAAINLLGLSVGLAAALLIFMFVRHEFAYERHFSEAGRIYRLAMEPLNAPQGDGVKDALSPQPLAGLLMQSADRLGIEAASRYESAGLILARDEDRFFERASTVDADFFRIFDFPFLYGDRETALKAPDGMVLSKAMARKYFGDGDPVGRTILVNNMDLYRVTGVLDDPPGPTEFRGEIYINVNNRFSGKAQWMNQNGPSFIMAREGLDRAELQRRLDETLQGLLPQEARDDNGDFRIVLEPLTDTHLHSGRWVEMNVPPASADTVYAMIGIGLALLTMVAINYTNLSTARATLRAKEIGLRKTLGAGRAQLVRQFIGESVSLSLVGLVLAIVLVELTEAAFADHLGLKFTSGVLQEPVVLLAGVIIALVLGVLGGFYPALVLSGFRPAAVLRSARIGVGPASRLRQTLVVVQFATAVVLAICTAVVYAQARYGSSANLGFRSDLRVVLPGIDRTPLATKQEALRQELLRVPGVVNATTAWIVPGASGSQGRPIRRTDQPPEENMNVQLFRIGHEYHDVLGVRMLAGRTLSRQNTGDSMPIPAAGTSVVGTPAAQASAPAGGTVNAVINAEASRRLGFASPAEALGRTIIFQDDGRDPMTLVIVGVSENVRQQSTRSAIRPALYIAEPVGRYAQGYMLVALEGRNLDATLAGIDAAWKRMAPELPVRRRFLDDQLEAMYLQEQRLAGVLASFSGLTLVIACLGLFALAASEAERRTKEIGVRKVLGAGVPGLVRLMVWQFSRPVALSILIAWPLAWLLMSQWLEGFAQRVTLSPALFLAAGLATLLVAWITVAGHALRVAAARPIHALRYE